MEPILTASHLSKEFSLNSGYFSRKDKKVYAARDVSFTLKKGESYGLVGVSGSGKTTTARMLVLMERPTAGVITYSTLGDITKFNRRALHSYRQKVRYIFQDPARSLNPRMTISEILCEPLRYSGTFNKRTAPKLIRDALDLVALPESILERRPMDFSGGQRQRISIARALITNPEILICDEVVSALDLSIQGQVINLLCDLKREKNLSFIFITHDLKVATYFCDRIGVIFKGELVEEGASDLYKTASHPYTKLLFSGASGEPNTKDNFNL